MKLINKPLNNGTILPQHVIAPLRWYCPSASSMKNNGMPPTANMIKYGTKNAPKEWHECNVIDNLNYHHQNKHFK